MTDLDALVAALPDTPPNLDPEPVRVGRRTFWVRRVDDRVEVEHRPSRYMVTVRDDDTYTVVRPAGRGCGLMTLESRRRLDARPDHRVEVREALVAARGR